MSPDYHLVSHVLCPYVQRVVVLMQEKNLQYRRTDIILSEKPDWFLSWSPTGRVPVLIIDDLHVLFESQVICDYLDEVHEPQLQPRAPLERARKRALIAVGESMLQRIAQLIYRDRTKLEVDGSVNFLCSCLRIVEAEGPLGPYFAGERFLLLDAVFATIFRYMPVLERLGCANILRDAPRLKPWRDEVLRRPSVVSAVPSQYDELLATFIAQQHSYLSERAVHERETFSPIVSTDPMSSATPITR